MDQRTPRTDLDRSAAEWEAIQADWPKQIENLKRLARAAVFGLMLAAALYAFGVEGWKVALTAGSGFMLCSINLGRHRIEHGAMLAFAIAALLWLQIPFVNRLLSAADRVLSWLGA